MRIILILLLIIFSLLFGCSDGIVSECPDDNSTIVRATFSSIQSEVINKSCALSGCHSGNLAAAGLDLSANVSYANIVNKQAPFGGLTYIIPQNADESYLFQRIISDSPGSVMPPTGRLPQSVIDSIRAWIELGAPNN